MKHLAGMTDYDAALAIAEDRIHVLVDLMGHTSWAQPGDSSLQAGPGDRHPSRVPRHGRPAAGRFQDHGPRGRSAGRRHVPDRTSAGDERQHHPHPTGCGPARPDQTRRCKRRFRRLRQSPENEPTLFAGLEESPGPRTGLDPAFFTELRVAAPALSESCRAFWHRAGACRLRCADLRRCQGSGAVRCGRRHARHFSLHRRRFGRVCNGRRRSAGHVVRAAPRRARGHVRPHAFGRDRYDRADDGGVRRARGAACVGSSMAHGRGGSDSRRTSGSRRRDDGVHEESRGGAARSLGACSSPQRSRQQVGSAPGLHRRRQTSSRARSCHPRRCAFPESAWTILCDVLPRRSAT